MKKLQFVCLLFLCLACQSNKPHDSFEAIADICKYFSPSDYFVVLLVDAPHLDYRSTEKLLHSIHQRSNNCQQGAFGHAWIYLQGKVNGQTVYLEGGHSGELGITQPKYFDRVMDAIENGEKDPIRYLCEIKTDGFFQKGAGEHLPTFAAKFDITEQQFFEILDFMQSKYSYAQYSLIGNQCCSFVASVASIIGSSLDFMITLPLKKRIYFRGCDLTLWHSFHYSRITLGSPDILEQSLIEEVHAGRAQHALDWYFE